MEAKLSKMGSVLLLFLLLGLFPVNTSAGDADLITGSGGRVIANMDIIHGDRSDYIRMYEDDGTGIKEFSRNFEKWDELAAGDVNGDGKDEIILGDRSDDRIHVLTEDGGELSSFDVDFEAGDDIETGDVNGDDAIEIIHADRDDWIRIYSMSGALVSQFSIDFEDEDRIAVGDVNGDGVDEIVHGDRDDMVRIYTMDGTKIGEFSLDFEGRDGLQCGDVNLDGVDEIVHADRNDVIHILDMEGNMLSEFSLVFEKGDGFAVGDVNMDGVDEIVHADRANWIGIYTMDGTKIGEFSLDFEEGDGFAVGDVNGDSIIVGAPIHSVQTIENQVVAIINAPPKHLGVINDPGVFYTKYENEIGQETSHSLKATSDVAITAKISGEGGFPGIAKIKANMKVKWGKKWEKTSGSTFSKEVGRGLTADMKDRVITVTTTYDVYEFPIINPAELAVIDGEQQYIMAMVPKDPPTVRLDDYDSPIHTLGDIRTYPSSTAELINYDSDHELDHFEFVLSSDASSSWLKLSTSDFTEKKDTTNLEASLSVTVSGGVSGVSKASFSVTGEYGHETVSTHKLTFTEDTAIHVNYEGGISEPEKMYTVRGVMYYDNQLGHLVVDFVVPETGSYYATDIDFSMIGALSGYYGNIFGGSAGGGYVPTGTILSVESGQMPQGSSIQIPINIENAENIGNMDIVLSYNPDVLTPVEVEAGALTSGSLFESNIGDGEIRIGFVDTDGITGNGSVAAVSFDVTGEPGDVSALTLTASANDVDTKEEIAIEVINGLFSVEDIEEMKGDCNGDGEITSVDALIALQMSVGKVEENLIGDMNDDGKVTSVDAAEILDLGTKGAVVKTQYELMGYSKGIKPKKIRDYRI